MARLRFKRALGIDRPKLALLALLPWALLMSSGGIHNHGLAATDRPAASESTVPGGAPRLQQDSAASPEAPCIACLWQLQSAAASSISPDVPAERVAPFRVPTYKGQSGVEEAFGFDPRAPPLS